LINQELVTGNEGFKDMISNISIDNCTIDNLLDYKYSQQENTKEIFDFIIKFNKYNFADQKIIVGNDDFEQLIILKSSSTNALFSAYLASLISLNDIGINKIDFYNEMISICKMIIKHYNKAQGYLPYHFFEYFLNCAASKMKLKELKRFFDECYSELLYLVNDNKYVIASLLGMIVSAKATGKISNVEIVKWAEIYLSTLQHDRYQEIQMIECKEEIAELVIPLVKNDKKIQLKLDLAHFLFNHKDIFIFTQKQEKLVKCITLLKNIDDPLEELNEYKIALTESNNETLSQIHEKSIPLPKKVVDLAMEEREKIFTFMEKMSDFSRFIYITFDLDLIKKSLLEYQINIMKKNSVFFSLIPSYHLDRFGNIIKNEQFSIEKREFLDNAVQPFDIILMTYFRDRLDAFLNYFSYDSETDAFLDSVFKNNLICNKTRTTYLKRIVSGILKNCVQDKC